MMLALLVLPALSHAQELGRVAEWSMERTMTAAEIDAFIEPLFDGYTAPRARMAVDIYELFVVTRYPNGRPTRTRVQLFVPQSSAAVPTDPRGVYVFLPGSTGLIGPCRASREHVAGIRWGLYRAHTLAFAGQGFIGILPDYMGYEDPALIQPYFHAASEARVVFDTLHAVDGWIRDRLPRGLVPLTRVAGGFSQGGHAAFAAADRNEELGGDLYLHGVFGYGPTTEIEPMFLAYPSLAPMVIQSFATVYGPTRFDPFRIVREPYASELEYDTTRQCVGAMQRYYPGTARAFFRADFLDSLVKGTLEQTHPSIARILQGNRTGLSGHGVPALILQGTNDVVVYRETQDEFVARLRQLGSDVDYRVYEDARHDTRQVAFFDVVGWIDSLDPWIRPQPLAGAARRLELLN